MTIHAHGTMLGVRCQRTGQIVDANSVGGPCTCPSINECAFLSGGVADQVGREWAPLAARVEELLSHNTELVTRARDAEARANGLLDAVLAMAKTCAKMAHEIERLRSEEGD